LRGITEVSEKKRKKSAKELFYKNMSIYLHPLLKKSTFLEDRLQQDEFSGAPGNGGRKKKK
jgi:hypothetical protein